MNETSWLECANPSRMMRYLRRDDGQEAWYQSWFSHPTCRTLPRKWRLFLAACCERVEPLFGDDEVRHLIEFAASFTDRPPTEDARQRLRAWFSHRDYHAQRVRVLRC